MGNILHYISHHKYSMRTYVLEIYDTWGCLLTFLTRNTQTCEKYQVQIAIQEQFK